MKLLRRFVAGLCIMGAVFLPFSNGIAQVPSGGDGVSSVGQGSLQLGQSSPTSILDSNRSFGSEGRVRSSVLLPALDHSGEKIFQEPSYSGLTYQVHILGEVVKPGTYHLPASIRIYEALQRAGGMSPQGSERRVELRRRGREGTRKIDLFSFKRNGSLDDNPYLLDNDVILVLPHDKVVEIEGPVKDPGTYELLNEKSLEDLIKLAGGFTPGVNKSTIKIVRISSGEKQLLDVENTETARLNFIMQKGDVVIIPHSLTATKKFDYTISRYPGDNGLFYPTTEERIFVLGAVKMAGPLPFNPSYGIRQYLTLAGGTTKLAKNRKIRVISSDGRVTLRRPKQNLEINPGDSIIVPERYLPPESILSLVLGLTTSVLGITTTVLTLTR